MVKPDVIIVWPKHVDYPIFRNFLHQNKDLFGKIIIAITDMNLSWDFREELHADLSEIATLFEAYSFGDWRDTATKQALELSESEWVLFIEQDFFISREVLLEVLAEGVQYGFKQEYRIHPAFLLLKRSRLELTGKSFAANPPHYDHFGAITIQLTNIKFLEKGTYEHLNGLTHNIHLCTRNEPDYLYLRERFAEYLITSCKYPCSQKYLDLVETCLKVLNENIR